MDFLVAELSRLFGGSVVRFVLFVFLVFGLLTNLVPAPEGESYLDLSHLASVAWVTTLMTAMFPVVVLRSLELVAYDYRQRCYVPAVVQFDCFWAEKDGVTDSLRGPKPQLDVLGVLFFAALIPHFAFATYLGGVIHERWQEMMILGWWYYFLYSAIGFYLAWSCVRTMVFFLRNSLRLIRLEREWKALQRSSGN